MHGFCRLPNPENLLARLESDGANHNSVLPLVLTRCHLVCASSLVCAWQLQAKLGLVIVTGICIGFGSFLVRRFGGYAAE